MFQIVTNNSSLELEPLKINVPCFHLINSNTSNSFVPMFNINSVNEEILDIESFTFNVSSIPSEYQMLELNIDSMEPLDEISTIYLNGSKYQNLLDIEELILFEEPEVIEEREST